MSGPVISSAVGISHSMCKLVLNKIRPKLKNLIKNPSARSTLQELQGELAKLLKETGAK